MAFRRTQNPAGQIGACHYVAMRLARRPRRYAMAGGIGANHPAAGAPPLQASSFGEDQARYLLTTGRLFPARRRRQPPA